MREIVELVRTSPKGSIHNRVLLIVAITNALSKMTDLQMEIHKLQMKEYSITEIGKELNIPRTTIQDEVKKIRSIICHEIRWLKGLEKLIED
jgi:predicted DNA-binding protein YlxM (UPF0122 family)